MGPLSGVRVIEMAGIGPGPFCAMWLADMGADVLRVDRPDGPPGSRGDVVLRNRRSVALDLKRPEAKRAVLRLCARADALIEGFRPGVMERLGLGPDEALRANPRLVYGRMTGWGQDGPLAPTAGHDINYIGLTGALHAIGPAGGPPVPPLNLVGDYGGGAMLLALGLLAGILSARASGQGQVVDAAMVDGAALLMAPFYSRLARGQWRDERGANLLDGAAPFYGTYACSCGGWLAVGPIEPQFFAEMLRRMELPEGDFAGRDEPSRWPALRARLAGVFASRSRDAWAAIFEGSDACVTPVLTMAEAPLHPHNAARGAFAEAAGVLQPAPAPRFSATPASLRSPAPLRGEHTAEALAEWGLTPEEISALAPGARGG
ncbi:MAG: CoA transferase [Acetobacteraceae bacterium]|nr:CoA transferase [Acetobacteraceae bacterium]